MTGFLDKNAPSIAAEYGRYVDGDILGKLIAKNFLLNRLGFKENQVYVPVGRYGDAVQKYKVKEQVNHDVGDGHVKSDGGRITFEVKCARINIANQYKGQAAENWAFSNVKTSPSKAPKAYDVLIAIGVRTLGLEDARYWKHLEDLKARRHEQGRLLRIDARPDEEDYLALCTFFIIRRKDLPTNFFRLTIRSLDDSSYAAYAAEGDDQTQCKAVWAAASR